jgi:transcriptional regulator with GAF, ATPase, and Fis domain
MRRISRLRDGLVSLWQGMLRLPGMIVRQKVVRRRLWVVLATFLVGSYALWVLGYVLATPEIGVRCAFTPVVNYFYSEFLYPENQAPLREGDRIVQLGDQPVENWSQLLRKLIRLRAEVPQEVPGLTPEALLGNASAAGGKTHLLFDGEPIVRVRFERPTRTGIEQGTVWCRLGRSPVETLLPSVLWFFLKVGLFGVGAMVLWKRPEDRSAAQFFWLCIVSFGAYMGGYHWSRIVTQPTLILVFMVCSLMLPAVSLHFYLLFPRPKGILERQPRWTLLAIYGPPLFFLLLLLTGYLRVRWLHRDGMPDVSAAIDPLLQEMVYEIYAYFAVAALLYLASIVCLVHSYRKAINTTERNQVRWILFGSLAALVPIGYSLYLAFWEKGRFGGGAATWPMFAASACVTAAYTVSITRYRLMQLDQVLSSGFVYFLFSSLVGVGYYGLLFVAMLLVGSQVGEGPTLGHVLGVSGTALVLLVVLDLVRGRFKRALDRHFRREKHQLDRTLQRMSQAIEQLVDPPTLGRRLLHTVAELLGASGGAVYLRQGDPPLYRLSSTMGEPPPLLELSSGCPLVEALLAHDMLSPPMPARFAPVQPGGSPSVDPAQRQLQFLGGALAHGLVHEGQLLGLLLLGHKGDDSYTKEDFDLLRAFAQITVLALVSAEGHRTIDLLNRDLQAKVEKIAEQQRRILALQSQLRGAATATRRHGDSQPATPESGLLAKPAGSSSGAEGMVGSSSQVQQLMHLVRKVAVSQSAVLLRGESGTGKELLARAIHENSPRMGKRFVKVHCAALSAGLLESELFGHVKGAFTSAIRDKVGRFEAAHGGTLFLDEIGDISLEVQTKLLRVLQEMMFERVGSSESVKVDVRLIAATHQDLEALIRQGRFREDLFYRLNVFPITLPPLRERLEDIPELALHFLRLYNHRAGKEVAGIDDDALHVLKSYSWPGNIRQLENVIERAVVIAEKTVLTIEELPDELLAGAAEPWVKRNGSPSEATSAEDPFPWPGGNGTVPEGVSSPVLASVIQAERLERERREREQLVRALAAAAGNKAEAARALGMARSTLVSRLKKLGLS